MEKRAKAQKKLNELRKKNPNISPVAIEGKIAKTWWGITWNKNLESYAKLANRLGSMAELADGKFPEELSEIFMKQGEGLFPSPKEIHMSCSCPDGGSNWMCKHVAAVLYAIGARLDTNPLLFFTLRGVDPSELIKRSVDEKMKDLLANANKKSKRVIDDADIGRLFGV